VDVVAEPSSDESFMDQALREAQVAASEDEVPVGAVVVFEGRVVARGRNGKEHGQDPTAHAEILALREAGRVLGRWRLTGATLYVTLEPCAMCAGAVVQARIDRLVFGCRDPKAGATGSLMNLVQDPRLNHQVVVTEGVQGAAASSMLKDFFRARRRGRAGCGELAELVEGT
jgi:tRNA(adenine34) deaminase